MSRRNRTTPDPIWVRPEPIWVRTPHQDPTPEAEDYNDSLREVRRGIANPPPPIYGSPLPVGSLVCFPGHRFPLRVMASYPEQWEPRRDGGVLTAATLVLADERDPSTQPYPVHRAKASRVMAYTWRNLLGMCELVQQGAKRAPWQLEGRAHFLDACAHLHDLAAALPPGTARDRAHSTADELLNGAAMAWWVDCETCLTTGTVNDPNGSIPRKCPGCGAAVAYRPGALALWACSTRACMYSYGQPRIGPCPPCNGTGRVPRLGDSDRLRLVEALIAAGLPERAAVGRSPWVDVPGTGTVGLRTATYRTSGDPPLNIGETVTTTGPPDTAGSWRVVAVSVDRDGVNTVDLIEDLP